MDSNELLYTQEQSYSMFYQNSEAIQKYLGNRAIEVSRGTLCSIGSEPMFRTIRRIDREIENLRDWEDDAYGCPTPDYPTISHAKNWITRLYFQVAFENWISPNITSGPEGEVVFEWWQDKKKLTVYISSQTAEYVQVWGTDIYEDMADGNADSIETCVRLWSWLRS